MNKFVNWSVAVLAVSALALNSAIATDRTWDGGGGDGVWQTPANWSSDTLPGVGDSAIFSTASLGTFTLVFTNDATARIIIGSTTPGVDVTFDLGGYTLTEDLATGAFDVNRYGALTVTNGTILHPYSLTRGLNIGYHDTSVTPLGAVSSIVIEKDGLFNFQGSVFAVATRYLGTLTITNGGTLLTDPTGAQGFYIAQTVNPVGSGGQGYSTGIMTVTGAGSTWTNFANNAVTNELRIGASISTTGTLNVVQSGLVMNQGGGIFVGYSGKGTVNIGSGGKYIYNPLATNRAIYLAYNAGAEGYLNIDGAGSVMTVVGSTTNRPEFRVGEKAGAVGAISISNQGVLDYQGTNFYLGNVGSGAITVSSGGALMTTGMLAGAYMAIGNGTAATGIVTVTGTGSVWTNGRAGAINGLRIAATAGNTGTLDITDGGTVVNNGTGNSAYVGYAGNGTLNIQSGGKFIFGVTPSYESLIIGNGSASVGSALVSGSGSRLDVSVTNGNITVGNVAGAWGTLIVESNAQVLAGSMTVGMRGTNGLVVVRDAGRLQVSTASGTLSLGTDMMTADRGYGMMIVTGANSYVLAGDIGIGNRSSTGAVVIADGGVVEMYRNVTVGMITNGAVTGPVSLTITGTGSVLRRTSLTSGDLPQAGMYSTSQLGIGASASSDWTLTGGTASDGTVRSQAEMAVTKGGSVSMNGRIILYSNSTLHVNGGHVQTTGNIGMETGSVFRATLTLGDANAANALVTAAGEVRIWGATLNVQLGDDFVYQYEDTYRLVGFGTLNSGYDRFAGLDQLSVISAGGVDFEVDYGVYDPGYITLTAIPEPGSLGLIGAGLGLAALLRRRRG